MATSHIPSSKQGAKLRAMLLGACSEQYKDLSIFSDEQGFGNPCGYMGEGTVGTGRGKNVWTLAKPSPSVWVTGYPHSSSMGRVSK